MASLSTAWHPVVELGSLRLLLRAGHSPKAVAGRGVYAVEPRRTVAHGTAILGSFTTRTTRVGSGGAAQSSGTREVGEDALSAHFQLDERTRQVGERRRPRSASHIRSKTVT